MDVIIVCHTEFGYVYENHVIFDKEHTSNVSKAVVRLAEVAERHDAKITFAVMPEVAEVFPTTEHEIGLHIHPGWEGSTYKDKTWYVGDIFLRKNCQQKKGSTILRDYSLKEQSEMIEAGKKHLQDVLGVEPKVFAAGRWSINNDTVKALITASFTHDCSAPAGTRKCHHDWSRLPRMCMPYRPSRRDYQKRGDLPLLIMPISQMIYGGSVNPELAPFLGIRWLKACFQEYYEQNFPFFHICLHSPIMADDYYVRAMDELLDFIAGHENVEFKQASEIRKYSFTGAGGSLLPYLWGINQDILKTNLKAAYSKVSKVLI